MQKSSSIIHRYRPIWVGMWFGELIHGPACIVSISTHFHRHILSTSLTSAWNLEILSVPYLVSICEKPIFMYIYPISNVIGWLSPHHINRLAWSISSPLHSFLMYKSHVRHEFFRSWKIVSPHMNVHAILIQITFLFLILTPITSLLNAL